MIFVVAYYRLSYVFELRSRIELCDTVLILVLSFQLRDDSSHYDHLRTSDDELLGQDPMYSVSDAEFSDGPLDSGEEEDDVFVASSQTTTSQPIPPSQRVSASQSSQLPPSQMSASQRLPASPSSSQLPSSQSVPPSQAASSSSSQRLDTQFETLICGAQKASTIDQAAMDVEFPDLLRVIASRTQCTVGQPFKEDKPRQLRMGAMFVPQEEPDEFLALSPSPNVLACADMAQASAAEAKSASRTCHMPAPFFPKGKIRQYCFSTNELLTRSAAAPGPEAPRWIANHNPGSRSWVAEQDLCVLESHVRETLAASSYLDGLQTAAASIIRTLDNPILLRLVMVSANALLEIVQRASHSLQLITMHRRDLYINGKPSHAALNAEEYAALRTAPCLGSAALFEPDILRRINNEHIKKAQEELTLQQFTRSNPPATHQSSYRQGGRGQPQKRQASNPPQGGRQPKQQRHEGQANQQQGGNQRQQGNNNQRHQAQQPAQNQQPFRGAGQNGQNR